MADIWVLQTQNWINLTYGDRIGMTVRADGVTRWEVMYALTRALQLELGITSLSDSFGPTTLATLTSRYPNLNATTAPTTIATIVQAAMYCKGYEGGGLNGAWGSVTAEGLRLLKTRMGVGGTNDTLTPKMVKGLLNMDPYVLVDGGDATTQAAQRWLNGRYYNRSDYFIIPCDGRSSRDVARALILGVQYELGMADGVANGVFGPGTRAGLRSHVLSTGSTGPFVSLFTAAMNFNVRPAEFTSTFTAAHASEIQNFQSFVRLPVTGQGDFQTWASLLISYGDQERKGEACDGVTLITAARAATLKSEGIKYLGRYLTQVGMDLPTKQIQPGELAMIASQGLRCFPIYQLSARAAGDFTYASGRAAGYAAANAAIDHGFKADTRIFFAVDFDALDSEVTSAVLPYFKGIEDSIADDGNRFKVGVYGPRNVCSRVAAAGHSSASFVSDMSSGFSGNFGYPMPADWAYDQIVTRTIGSGAGAINIDVNIASGRDIGQASFNPPRSAGPDVIMEPSLFGSLGIDVNKYMETIGFPENGGVRNFTHIWCFMRTIYDHDNVITELSNRHNMRKAMIQTSAYWEMRHWGVEDDAQDLRVQAYHNGIPGGIRDSSTGIAQIQGGVGILAWNHAFQRGYETGIPLNPTVDDDVYTMWNRVRDDNAYALRTVAMIHLWGADGKPGGSNPPAGETDMRPMALDYNDSEVFQILRRYQGWGDETEVHAGQRMALYYIFEKYNAISRNF